MNSAKLPLFNKVDDVKIKCSCTSIFPYTILLITSLAILLWVILLPKSPIITVKEALVDRYTLTGHNHLNAAFNFVLRVHNPNTKLSLYYDHLEFKAYHGGQVVAYDGVEPFQQPNESLSLLNFRGVAIDMPLFESPGEVDLILEMKGRLWFKVGTLTLYRYKFKIMCFPVVVHLDRIGGLETSSCYIMLE
uniref:Late embryogenesis abundant protein LEA-2 subgroup domain-containing protein n=1 Tax=Chenopodium quinoa TaxID=63459 RepID=A0A803M6E9_CHEQI